jgi:hypothetical protein
MVSKVGNSKCPKCGNLLDGVSVVRYDGPFACPFCKMELHVPGYYKAIMLAISIGASFILCTSIGLRWPGFIVGYFIFLFPAIFSVSILQRKISPPKLVACADDPSPFS